MFASRARVTRAGAVTLVVATVALSAMAAAAQGTRADYARAENLRRLTQGKVFKATLRPVWFDNGNRFWYRNDLADGAREFILVDAPRGTRGPAFDHARVAEALGRALGRPIRPTHLPIDRIEFTADGKSVRLAVEGKGWEYSLATGTLVEGPLPAPLPPAPGPEGRGGRVPPGRPPEGRSPDGKWQAFVRDHNLFLRDTQTNEEFPLTTDATATNALGPRIYWSPDSSRLVAVQTKAGGDRQLYLVESTPRDQLQPRLHTRPYLKPGDPIPQPRPRLFEVASRREIPIDNALFPNPWEITRIRWERDGRRFTFIYNERGHQVLRIVAVDAQTGEARALVDERSSTFIDYAHKQFAYFVEATGEIIWMSERDGWNHLYLYDGRTGRLKNPITRGPWVVRGVDRVDAERRQIWFRAGGIYPEQDPYYVHYCRIGFDGNGLVLLTQGDGTHTLQFSPDGRYYVDTYSRVDLPPVHELRRSEDGALICELERADWSALLATGWRPPERFVAKGRDGQTDIYGVIYRPTNFDPNRRYPVIEEIYAGPQGAFVPKAFREYYGPQALAELGFIVVQIDGMGTSHRSKAFHDVCWKNLGDAGFPDRIRWLEAAAARYPWMDLSRVGIYGTSAGGQSALRGMLMYPDFYRVGVAICGCHDNRLDKIWWNELWMGWPVGPHYAEQSNVTQAHRLQGKLLLIVGEMDTNVDPASTMQVVDALIRADKDFDLLVIPGGGHGIGGPYGVRRMRDFFVRHLLGVEPRRQ